MSSKDWIEKQHPDCEPDIHRSFKRDVASKLDFAEQFGHVGKYPLYYVSCGRGPIHVLVTGGVHGDEPAGTHAAVDLARSMIGWSGLRYDDVAVHIYPCINPWGYEHNRRHDKEGIDLNRGFKDEIEGEACKLFAEHLAKTGVHEYVFTIDFHEGSRNMIWKGFTLDDNPDGNWLYETCHTKEDRMGRRMIDAMRGNGFPVNTLKTVYEDLCHYGLISYPEDMKSPDYATQDSFDAYLWKLYTRQSFTSETNMDQSIEDRIKAHHVMFFAAMNLVRP